MAENTGKKNALVEFFKGLKAEFLKIKWPTKGQIAKQTVAVVIISVILCVFIVLFDLALQYGIKLLGTIF